MKTTPYFEFSVRRRRPHLNNAWIEKALAHPEYVEIQCLIQPDGRIRHCIYIEEYDKFLRVIIDKADVLNASLDRRFNPKKQ